MGCTAEPKSCRNPGSVSGSVRAPPPGYLLCLEDLDIDAGLCQHDGSGESVGAGADDIRPLHALILSDLVLVVDWQNVWPLNNDGPCLRASW